MTKSKRSTSLEIAYEKILQKIISEQFTPGMPLREDRLAKEFDVSTTPIREAFRRLEYEGWLQSIPFCGVFLRKFSIQDIDELYRLREGLEGIAAAAAARCATPDEMAAIAEVVKSEQRYMENAIQSHDHDDVPLAFSSDMDFHAAVLAASHNDLLKQRLTTLKAQITFSLMLVKKRKNTAIRLQEVCEEHHMIFIAMQRGWDDLAEALMRRHISEARKKYADFARDDGAI